MQRSIHSQKFVEKRRKRRQIILFLIVICFFTVAASLILIMRAPFLQIKSIAVENPGTLSPEAITASAITALSGSYFHIIPYSNSFLYSKSAIKETLAENFKAIHDVKVSRSGLRSLKISLKQRDPAAIVCASFREDADESSCYWSDERGLVFAKIATSTTNEKLNHYYVPAAQDTVTPGKNFVPEKRFSELQKFLLGTSKGGLYPLGVLVGESGEYEMYVKNKTGNSEVTVYFDDRNSFDKTLENLLTFWQNPAGAKKATTTVDFNYINLRFGNTVYYSTQ
jgi:hypothetical protein